MKLWHGNHSILQMMCRAGSRSVQMHSLCKIICMPRSGLQMAEE